MAIVPPSKEENDDEDRWETIKEIWRDPENRWLYALAGFAIGVSIGITAIPFVSQTPRTQEALSNLFPTFVGIAFTVTILDRLYDRRDKMRQKDDLIAKMGSRIKDVAIPAAEELNRRGWLNDGSLRRAKLWYANLEGVQLIRGDLREAEMISANLQSAYLPGINLQSAILSGANLKNANLHGSNLKKAMLQTDLRNAMLQRSNLQEAILFEGDLRNADLKCADLRNVHLYLTKLQGADLRWANLEGARLDSPVLDSKTKLPDNSEWTHDTDLTRFTDSKHPGFWRGFGMRSAKLRAHNLRGLNLEGADLYGTDFQGANLSRSNLRRAWLVESNLLDTNLTETEFDEFTELPDGTNWSPEADLKRFTDSTHPLFWRSNDPKSPSYGKSHR
jgi:uncharacterized protein YjbI with pentapeptide repeats